MKVVEEGVVEGKRMVMALLFAAFDEAVDDGAAVAETVGALDVCADPLGRGFRVPVFRLRVDDIEGAEVLVKEFSKKVKCFSLH